jgi:hypothetical protein
MEGLRRLGGSGTQASVELRRFDEFLAAEKLERVWVTPLSAEAVQGRYQTWLQAQGIMSQLSPRQISAALKSRQEVFVIQHNPRAAPLFSLVKFEEDAVPPRPLPALRPPPRAPMRGAVSATPKERALGAKCSTLQAKLGKVSQSLRNSQRSVATLREQRDGLKDAAREAAVLKMKLERSRRAGKMAKWRSKRRAAISRSLRAVNGELAVQVSQLETRLYKLSHVSGATTSFLQTALLASAADVMAVRQELLSARDDASAAVNAAARSAAETARIEKELEKVAGPLHLREGGAVCDEVRAAAVAIAAGGRGDRRRAENSARASRSRRKARRAPQNQLRRRRDAGHGSRVDGARLTRVQGETRGPREAHHDGPTRRYTRKADCDPAAPRQGIARAFARGIARAAAAAAAWPARGATARRRDAGGTRPAAPNRPVLRSRPTPAAARQAAGRQAGQATRDAVARRRRVSGGGAARDRRGRHGEKAKSLRRRRPGEIFEADAAAACSAGHGCVNE